MIRIVKHDPSANRPDQRANVFIGDVFSQTLVSDEDTPSLRVTSVRFEDGARNRFHTHTTEQVLIVTHGSGRIITEDGEQDLTEGDVALIPALTRHWHGAKPGTSMTHLAILLPGKMEVDETDQPLG